MTRAIYMGVVIVVLSALARFVAAQGCPQPAKDAFGQAQAHYNVGEYREAATMFKQAYDLCPTSYGVLYNLGQSHRLAQNYDQAIIAFRSWLRQARTDPQVSPQQITDTEQIVTELADMLAAQRRSDEKPPQGLQDDPSLTGGRGDHGEGEAAPWYRDPIGWTLVAVGVAGVAVGSWSLLHAGGLYDDAHSAPTEADQIDLADSADGYRLAGGVSLGVGAVALTVGVIKLVIHDRGGDRGGSGTRVEAACGFGWCGLRGSF